MNFITKDNKVKDIRIMSINDIVIIYERYDIISYIKLESYGVLENKYGMFYHNNFIGKPYGSKIYSKNKNGWLYALEPTPELWSHAMHTRTQIVDESDSSYVTFALDIFPGCKVVESGTGSGNMTLSLARAISPNGHVYSYEYNATRAKEAISEFESLNVSHLITVQCTDVCATEPDPLITSSSSTINNLPYEQQFGFIGCESDSIDAVFLDLPEPWKAIPHAFRILKSGRSICCYSPCMEQVNKTCAKLRELNFHSIRMTEVRQRPFEGRKVSFPTPDLGQTDLIPINTKQEISQNQQEQQEQQGDIESKNESEIEVEQNNIEFEKSNQDDNQNNSTIGKGKRRRNQYETREFPPKEYIVGRAMTPMKGHTAFLTFAVCPEKKVSINELDSQQNQSSNIEEKES